MTKLLREEHVLREFDRLIDLLPRSRDACRDSTALHVKRLRKGIAALPDASPVSEERKVCPCGDHEVCVTPNNPNCARLLRAPQQQAEPVAWLDYNGWLVRRSDIPDGGVVDCGRAIPESWTPLPAAQAEIAALLGMIQYVLDGPDNAIRSILRDVLDGKYGAEA